MEFDLEVMASSRPLVSEHDDDDDDGDDGEDDTPIELQPALSPQQEQQELATLSIADLADLQSDLTGIASGVAGLSLGGHDDSSTHIDSSLCILSRLDEEVSKLPRRETEAYRRATMVCPDQVSNERKLIFLEHENGDPALAARRIVYYWNHRLYAFGPDRCYLPMTLAGAMRGEATNLICRPINQPLPVTDTAGRAIFLFSPGLRNFDAYSYKQEMMALLYLLESVIERPDVRRNGVVLVIDGRNIQRRHFSREFRGTAAATDSCFPFHVRALHFCYPNAVLYYLLLPALKMFVSKDVRLRMKLHFGSTSEVLRSLEAYSLPRDRLPVELGGDVILDMNAWVKERASLERSRIGYATVTDDGPSMKRVRTETLSAASSPLSAEGNADSSTSRRRNRRSKERKRGKGGGKPSDPRMTKAIKAKQEDSSLSLYDALVAGGFVFRKDGATCDIVDADGIALAQRKNNLCRRLRIERKKLEEQNKCKQLAAVSADASDTYYGSAEDASIGSFEISCGELPSIIPPSFGFRSDEEDNFDSKQSVLSEIKEDDEEAIEAVVSHTDSLVNFHDNSSARVEDTSTAIERRDSFCEAISELPGIEDMDDIDIFETWRREEGQSTTYMVPPPVVSTLHNSLN